MIQNKFQTLLSIKDTLQKYHGATKLQNIPEVISSSLYADLTQNIDSKLSLDITIRAVIKKITDVLNVESIMLQFGTFQEQIKKKQIVPSQRMPENQRLEFYTNKATHERVEMLFSPELYYFTLNPASFKKDDKKYNRWVFQKAMDTVVIDPDFVAESSLATLDITLDPDCQNLKNIFKKMYPLHYQDADQNTYTIRIHEYEGKYIVFAAHKVIYDAQQPATKGEQRKEDIVWHMSVYPDIFSMVRREEHIIDWNQERQAEYQDIKKKLLVSIKEIEWNKKEYSIRVQQNVQEIIGEIDAATSAKILADKLYHLYKITWKHSENDKKLLEASMRSFTQRIAQLIGISSRTQLHLLKLNDVLDDQNLNLKLFYTQIQMFLAEPNIRYSRFLVAFENYYTAQRWPLKEPFRTFDMQIKQCFGDIDWLRKKDPQSIMAKAAVIIPLQKKFRESYTWEHAYKLWDISLDELQENLFYVSSDIMLKEKNPWLYDAIFLIINQKRATFSSDFTKVQLNHFFDELNDLALLQWTINLLDGMFT